MHYLVLGLLKGMIYPISEHAEQIYISWDSLQFICISLCRSILKSMSDPISDHAEKLVLAEMVFNCMR